MCRAQLIHVQFNKISQLMRTSQVSFANIRPLHIYQITYQVDSLKRRDLYFISLLLQHRSTPVFLISAYVCWQLKHVYTNECWDAVGWAVGRNAATYGCHKRGGSQLLRLNTKGQLASGERCLVPRGGHVQIIVCPTEPTGDWEYLEVSTVVGPSHVTSGNVVKEL